MDEQAFEVALDTGDARKLLKSVPRLMFLEWLTRRGYLLHGSSRPDIVCFDPRAPKDLSPDEFSKRTAVFASSNGVWALMYALRDRTKVGRTLNMALQVKEGDWLSQMCYFLSFAPVDSGVVDGRSLLSAGSVYVLAPEGFEQMPEYYWPGLGTVLEPHWANSQAVRPLMQVTVSPEDFPLPVRTHDATRVDALSRIDPWGFPWLEHA